MLKEIARFVRWLTGKEEDYGDRRGFGLVGWLDARSSSSKFKMKVPNQQPPEEVPKQHEPMVCWSCGKLFRTETDRSLCWACHTGSDHGGNVIQISSRVGLRKETRWSTEA